MIQMYPNQDVEEWLIKKNTKTFKEKQTTPEKVIKTNSKTYANVGYN